MNVYVVVGPQVRVFLKAADAIALAEVATVDVVHECPVEGMVPPRPKVQVIRHNGHAESHITQKGDGAPARVQNRPLVDDEGSEYIDNHPPGQPPPNRVVPADLMLARGLRVKKCDLCPNVLPAGGSASICPKCIAAMGYVQSLPPPNGPAPPTPGAEMM